LTKTYADDLLKFNPPMPISFLTKSRTQPVSMLSKESFDKLVYRMEIIREACKNTMHLFRNRMIRSALMMFLLDVSDIHIREYGSDKLFEISRRGIALFHSFMEMLPIHAAVEHNVAFYANQLCVTPQYLNRIVKSASGRTISEWINFQLIGMITKRIEETEDSMLQIANEYNFTDQAALTKFYKRETGYTPSSYRIKCSDK
ncbi:MAG: helix-turn-helix domain-containing protein, partial [Prevotella sp.]